MKIIVNYCWKPYVEIEGFQGLFGSESLFVLGIIQTAKKKLAFLAKF